MLITASAAFIATIGHTSMTALKTSRMLDATRLRARSRSSRVCRIE